MEHFDPWSREAIHHTSSNLNTSFMVADDTEAAELRSEGLAMRQYLSSLAASPDCRDPDHPGCAKCEQDGEQ